MEDLIHNSRWVSLQQTVTCRVVCSVANNPLLERDKEPRWVSLIRHSSRRVRTLAVASRTCRDWRIRASRLVARLLLSSRPTITTHKDSKCPPTMLILIHSEAMVREDLEETQALVKIQTRTMGSKVDCRKAVQCLASLIWANRFRIRPSAWPPVRRSSTPVKATRLGQSNASSVNRRRTWIWDKSRIRNREILVECPTTKEWRWQKARRLSDRLTNPINKLQDLMLTKRVRLAQQQT